MIKYCFGIIGLGMVLGVSAQKFETEKGTITFFSDGVIEDISAENVKGISIIDAATLNIAFSLPVREFQFRDKLMQEHFNTEKYMHSEKFPKATFSGKLSALNLVDDKLQPVTAKGKLTMHGITREVELTGTLQLVKNKLILKSRFKVKLADFNITIPKVLWQNIAEEVEVSVDFTYKPR